MKVLIVCAGLVCLAGFIAAKTAIPPASPIPLAWVEAPRFDEAAWLRGAERFPAGAQVRIRDGHGTRALAPDFAASADPSVSWDGERVLFSGRRKAGDSWQVYETSVSGQGKVRQISDGVGDCVRPFYLPEDKVVWTRIGVSGSWIEIGAAERLTFSGARVLTDDVLQDGRILFETQFRTGGASVREIMTVYPDGTGVESVRCDHGADRHSGRQTSDGDIVFIDHGRLARFTPALAHEIGMAQPAGEFAGPVADTGNGSRIVAMRQNAQGRYRLVQWLPGSATTRQIVAGNDTNTVEPVVLAPHEPPRRFPSARVASRTSLNLLCLNTYTSREAMGTEPIRSVRIFTQGPRGEERLLGQTAIEKDGSFFVQLPADQPVRLEVLDAAGKVLRAERNWWWGRPAEQRVCVGCHAGPERAPENAVPQVLLRKDVPVKMLASEGIQ